MKTQGHVFKYGDNVDTDVIIPARYLNTADANELAKHCMEDIDTTFVEKVAKGDIMVAGWNFGCGSSREHAPLVIKTCGTGCVIAKSFARIFAGTPSTSAFPFWNVKRRRRKFSPGTRWRWTLTPALSPMPPPGRPIRRSHFRTLSRTLFKRAGCWLP